jgi:hypothetical protein
MARSPSWTPANHTRISRTNTLGGWDLVRHRLKGEDDVPRVFFFDTCTAIIRTLPAMQHSTKNIEDLDTESEDHAVDQFRYACSSWPYVSRDRSLPVGEPNLHAIDDSGSQFPQMRVNLEPLFRAEERRSKRSSLSGWRIH